MNHLILAASVLLFGCSNNNGNNEQAENLSGNEQAYTEEGYEPQQGGQPKTGEGNPQQNGNWQRLVMKQFKDNNGQLLCEMPFPASWNVPTTHGQNEPSITGPNGVKVFDYPMQMFSYSNDPFYQIGQQRALPSIEQLIEQDIKPSAASKGLQLVKTYEIPEIAKLDKWYKEQLYSAVPTQSDAKAIGTEWVTADGKPCFILVRLVVSGDNKLQQWYYLASSLQADKEHFEAARKQYVFSLAATRYAMEPIAQYNRQEAERCGKSWAAHNARMAQNWANFEAHQRAHVNKTNAINDAIMSGYNSRMSSMDKNQEMFVDAIREETKVQNTSTGGTYKVESHYNNYWMNSNGEYISTNQSTYNPNLDENLNNQKWDELKKVDY